MLLIALLAYRLYPYVPTIDAHKYWHSVKPLITHPGFAPWPIFRYFILWLTVSYLLAQALRRNYSRIAGLLFAAFVFAAKVVIVGQTLSASEIAGAVPAFFLWFAFLGRSDAAPAIVLVLLGASVTILRLQPFEFHAQATQFGWMPFRSILRGSLGADYVACVEKIFLYGSLIWIGSRAGLSLWISTCGVGVLLLVTSLAETHLPGRSAEVTDCVMAVLIGCGLAALNASKLRHVQQQDTAEEFHASSH
jgi:VanZ family protein